MATTISKRGKKQQPTELDRKSAHRPVEEEQLSPSGPWYATFALAMAGAALVYLCFPPFNFWMLAWLAPIPWLLLVRAERLPSRRPYRWLYLAGFLHWLLLVQWVRLGHWAAHFGWIALSLYLACYLPLFVWLSRVAVHRFRVPLVFAAPTIWVGLECLRGWAFTGLSIALLGHTQIHWLPAVQIADLAGAYAVSFVVMLVAAAFAECVPLKWLFPALAAVTNRQVRWWPIPVAGVVLAATLAYGFWRMQQTPAKEFAAPPARIALIQGSIDTDFDDHTLNERMFKEYRGLTIEALRQNPDAILWPESTLPYQMIDIDRRGNVEKGKWLPQDEAEFNQAIGEAERGFHALSHALGHIPEERRHVPLLLGTSTLRLGDHSPQRLNSAVFVNDQGHVAGAYHKLHPVMFGEYAPGGKLFPWIYEWMPFPAGLTPGEKAESLEIAGLRMCPSICYENTVPHLIRRQVVQLQREGADPDVLVTLSNDGWFYGSAELDMHLICGQFRAIEMRKPALVVANTGISAHIADDGRLLAQGPRRKPEVVIAEVRPAWRESLYTRTGDLFANACLLICCLLAIAALIWRGGSAHPPSESSQGESDGE